MSKFNGTDQSAEDILQVDQNLAIKSMARRMQNPKLMALRAQNPFMVIDQMPDSNIGVVLSAGAPVDIPLAAEIKMIRFSGNCEYYVSRNGNAQIPGTAGLSNPDLSGACGMMNPEDRYFYVEEVTSISIVSPTAGKVTIACFTQG